MKIRIERKWPAPARFRSSRFLVCLVGGATGQMLRLGVPHRMPVFQNIVEAELLGQTNTGPYPKRRHHPSIIKKTSLCAGVIFSNLLI